MRLDSPFAYHSTRLASDRRWASAYRSGRAEAVHKHGLGYGEPQEVGVLGLLAPLAPVAPVPPVAAEHHEAPQASRETSQRADGVVSFERVPDMTSWRPPRRRGQTRQG